MPLLFAGLAINEFGGSYASADWYQYDQIVTFWIIVLVGFLILSALSPKDKGPRGGNGDYYGHRGPRGPYGPYGPY